MTPRTALFGAIPAARGNAASPPSPVLPAGSHRPKEEFFALVSQARTKSPDKPAGATPATPGNAAPPSSRTVPTGLPGRGEEFFSLASPARSTAAAKLEASQPPRAISYSAPGNVDSTEGLNDATGERETPNAATPKSKGQPSSSASVNEKEPVDASALSAIMGLLTQPATPPADRPKLVPVQSKDFQIAPEQGDIQPAKPNHSANETPTQKPPASPVPLSSGAPVRRLDNLISKPAVQETNKSNADAGKPFPPSSPPTVNESPPGNPDKPPAYLPQPTVVQDVPLVAQATAGAADPLDGTRAALNGQRMKSTEEKNEIAGRTTQKVPDAAATDHSSTGLIGKVNSKPDSNLSGQTKNTFDSSPLIPVSAGSSTTDVLAGKLAEKAQPDNGASAQVERVAHLVSREAVMIRQSGANSLAVSLKVDSHTELYLQLTNHDGQIQASVRCERGNIQELGSRWGELQESLARQNVQLMPLED